MRKFEVRRQITDASIRAPRWGRDSREIFYIEQGHGNRDSLLSVSIKPSQTLIGPSAPVTLFTTNDVDIRPANFAGVAPAGRLCLRLIRPKGRTLR